MDRDLVVLVESSSPHLPNLVLEKEEGGEGSTVALLSFVPNFRLILFLTFYLHLPLPYSLKEHKMEAIFLVDCSGSMSGQSIKVRA